MWSIISFLHFAHGPHFKDSRLSTSEHDYHIVLDYLHCHVFQPYDIQWRNQKQIKAMRAFGSFRRKRKVRD